MARRYGRLTAVHADDGDLHVDVMRFFAIIAMCLFAILPHRGAPKVQSESDLQQMPAMAEIAAPTVSKVIAPAQPSQEAALFTADQSNLPKALSTVDSLSTVERVVVAEPQPSPLPKVASTMPAHREKSPSVGSLSEQEEGVRFLNSNAFAVAVSTGAIALVYHGQNESLVFDPAVSRFIRLGDASLQIFGLAASEVPSVFHRALPKIHQADVMGSQWFITLPERTLAHLLSAQTRKMTKVVLNNRAQPI